MMSSVKSGQLSPACKIPMYFIQAAPLVSFVLVAFRVLQRWMIEFRVARGENVFDPAHPERNTPESFIEANAGADNATENALNAGIDNRIHTIKIQTRRNANAGRSIILILLHCWSSLFRYRLPLESHLCFRRCLTRPLR